ncbi:hypothetical protein U1Q18_047965 [Sarracenia purpurea var. burkii]
MYTLLILPFFFFFSMMMECGTGPSSGSGGVTSGGAPVMGGDDDDVMAEGDGGLPPLLQVPLGMPKFFDLATYAPRTHRLDEVAMRQWEPMGVSAWRSSSSLHMRISSI